VRRLATWVLTAGCLAAGAATAGEDPTLAEGRELAEVHCSRCHAVGPEGRSPMAEAPPFRDLERRYPIETLAEALAEGIVTGHPQMPVFTFQPGEIDALLAYLDSLR
jgi:mono/diheme cytochrome c family protein